MKQKISYRFGLGALLAALLPAFSPAEEAPSNLPPPRNFRVIDSEDFAFYPGDYSEEGVIGNRLPGAWRPFSVHSPWNVPIPGDAPAHPDSAPIMEYAVAEADHIRFARSYIVPVWVVNGDNIAPVRVRSDMIFDWWDRDRDGWSDVGIPLTPAMWPEPTSDGHICIIDPFRMRSYEMSKFSRLADGTPTCTTFNIWDITSRGTGDSSQGNRWGARGGRGSGFPVIAGLIRPEEISAGEIRHALVFTFPRNRLADDGRKIFIDPACRSDGRYAGSEYPIEGMRFQLDPSLTEQDLDELGLSREGKIVARALQIYGMFVGDNGGAMALQVQLLASTPDEHHRMWEERFPGMHKNIERITTDRFRVVYTGDPIIKE